MDGDVNIFKNLMVYNMDVAKLGKHIMRGNPNELHVTFLYFVRVSKMLLFQ